MLDYPVTTPENVRLRYILAGPTSRLVAWAIDAAVVSVVLMLGGVLVSLLGVLVGELAIAIYGVLSFAWITGYWIFFEYRWDGLTPGKRVVGLRVVADGGLRLDLTRVVLRNLLRVVDVMPGVGGVGILFAALDVQHRRLGDLVAGTVVIREHRVAPPGKVRDVLGRLPSGLDIPPEAARRLAQRDSAFLIELALRRDRLPDALRLQLFEEVAAHYRDLLDLPQPPGVSAERWVLALTARTR